MFCFASLCIVVQCFCHRFIILNFSSSFFALFLLLYILGSNTQRIEVSFTVSATAYSDLFSSIWQAGLKWPGGVALMHIFRSQLLRDWLLPHLLGIFWLITRTIWFESGLAVALATCRHMYRPTHTHTLWVCPCTHTFVSVPAWMHAQTHPCTEAQEISSRINFHFPTCARHCIVTCVTYM